MKKLLLSLVAIATLSLTSFGQVPEGFKYQAVIRNASNTILANQAVGMRLTLQQGSIGGTAVYTETFTTSSNAYGLVNLEIGTGTTTDDFTAIDWANGPYFMEIAVDLTGGTSYVVMGTSQLMSVPYALHAKTADNVINDLVNDADADSTNELNISVTLNGTNLETTDAGGTIITDLSSLTGASGNWMLSGINIYNTNSGNVGIGTTTPVYNLSLSNAAGPKFAIGATAFNNISSGSFSFLENVGDVSGECGFKLDHNGADNSISLYSGCYIPSAGDTIFRAYRDGYMNIRRLGIGSVTMNPASPLSVVGNASFVGDMTITGNLNVTGTIAKGGGTFRIDHPKDPANKYLIHSFVESPDMMNIYSGNVITDANGYATVELPGYFEAANKDFRYQLTVIGTFAQAIVKEKISDNRFVVQTSEPNVEVSWSVTGIRADKFANANRVQPEMDKEIKGTYVHPELYNVSTDHSVVKAVEHQIIKSTSIQVGADQ